MHKAIKNIVRLVLKNFSFLLILFVLFTNNVPGAEEAKKKFIGFVDSLEGSVNKKDVDDLIKLNAFDQIFTNDKIKIGPNSSIVVSFIDNSILTLQSDSEFLVEKFDKISEEPSFIIAITKGKFAFESGTIAKNDKSIMKIKLGEMEIDLKGTAITGGFSGADIDGGEVEISLVEDTMKNIGTITITAGDETIVITEAHAGLKLSEDKPMEKTAMSEEEIIEAADAMSKAVVQASTIDPKKIERAIMKQLAEGKSGLTNLADVETLLADISSFQDDKRESIVAASTGDLSVLSEIIVNSDSEQSLSLMQGVMDNDTGSATLLMNEIMGREGEKADFDIFSHIAGADTENFEALRETIVAGMIEDQSTFATDTMAQMMKVSDDATGSYLVYEITHVEPTETTDAGASLAMNVLASFTANASEKMADLYQHDPSMINMLTTSAFENATEQDIGMMSTMMQDSTGGNMAMLMKSMVAYSPKMIGGVYNNLAEQNYDLFDHIETARMEMERYDPYMDPTYDPSPMDPYYDPGTAAADPYMDPTYDPSPMDPYYDPGIAFIDSLKGNIFSEIINYSDVTASETASNMMMKTGGNSAIFMMENMMSENPEMMTQVMDNFMYQDFDIFIHMKEPTYDPYMDPTYDPSPMDPYYDPGTAAADPFMDPTYDPSPMDPYYDPAMSAMQDFQANIIDTMMEYGGAQSMETMAYMMSTGDATNSAFILESVMGHSYDPYMDPNYDPYSMDTYYDPYAETTGEQNLTLILLDEMGEVDPDMMGEIYEQQTSLMEDMFEEAFQNATAADASMIANIMSSGTAGEDMTAMMFDKLEYISSDQNFMSEIFYDIAEQSPETLIAMAAMDQTLYENLAQDPYNEGMSAENLMKDIMMAEGYDPYMDPTYDPYSMDTYYDPYMDPFYDPYSMGTYYDPYMDPIYDPYSMDTYYDPYLDPYYDPYSMGAYYDPYMDPFYDPYLMGAYYDPYMDPTYDPYMMDAYHDPGYAEVDDDDLDDVVTAATRITPFWDYMYRDPMYQISMYDGTNRNRGTFSASNTVASMADETRQIYSELLFSPGSSPSSAITVEEVEGSELPTGLNIIKPAGYDHVEIYGTLPTVNSLTEYNFALEVSSSLGVAQQQFTFYVDEGGVTRVSWRDPTIYTDNIATKYFGYDQAIDVTLEATTINTDEANNNVLFVADPNPPVSWLDLEPVTIQVQETEQYTDEWGTVGTRYLYDLVQNEVMDYDPSSATYEQMIPATQLDYDPSSATYNQMIPVYTNEPRMVEETLLDQIKLAGTSPDDLAFATPYTFTIKAYEEGADLNTITAEQYNDKEFTYTIYANPGCVTPAVYDCPGA